MYFSAALVPYDFSRLDTMVLSGFILAHLLCLLSGGYLFARLRHLCFPVLLHFRHLVFFAFFAFAIEMLPPSFRLLIHYPRLRFFPYLFLLVRRAFFAAFALFAFVYAIYFTSFF